MERGSLAEKYFKIMIVQMTQDLGKGMGSVYKRPRRTKAQTEMNSALGEINSRIIEAGGQVSDLADRMVEVIAIK